WVARGTTYAVIQQQLRNVGGRLGHGGPAVAEAANATARLRALKQDTIIEPRVQAGFQTLFDRIDQRIADIVEDGIDRGAFVERSRHSTRSCSPAFCRRSCGVPRHSRRDALPVASQGLRSRCLPRRSTPSLRAGGSRRMAPGTPRGPRWHTLIAASAPTPEGG